ncbi:MAG: aldose 1-epimerase family protein, partial [Gammaproteobacteria bacterium]
MTHHILRSSDLSIKVADKGAELQSLKQSDGLELLWQADPKVWPRHAPHLFPIVGRLPNEILRHEGKNYTLTQHGFARDLNFICENKSDRQCTH